MYFLCIGCVFFLCVCVYLLGWVRACRVLVLCAVCVRVRTRVHIHLHVVNINLHGDHVHVSYICMLLAAHVYSCALRAYACA